MQKRTRPIAAVGPSDEFTGNAFIEQHADGSGAARTLARKSHFAPGSRTHWHSHALGQTIHCLQGVGMVVNRNGLVLILSAGETVWTAPGEEHWHGATCSSICSQLELGTLPEEDDDLTMLEPVSDEDYHNAHSRSAFTWSTPTA